MDSGEIADNFLKYLDSEEVERKIREIFEETNEYDKNSRKIVSDEKYIKWLEEFSLKHKSFEDVDCMELSQTDKDNVNNLRLFFRGVELYAIENDVDFMVYEAVGYYNYYYPIMYNEKIYEIGIKQGQGSACTSKVKELVDYNDMYIDFKDIVSYNKSNEKNKTYIKK